MPVDADQIKRPSGTFAPVAAHGPLEYLCGRTGAAAAAPVATADAPADGVWIVRGSFPMSPAGTFPRAMTVVRHGGGRLAIINSMRLDGAGRPPSAPWALSTRSCGSAASTASTTTTTCAPLGRPRTPFRGAPSRRARRSQCG
eukprot:TRINITY_DN1679_c0_g1_i1.p3 TRINITY_DN1679_c0_g1~~TRINITY_DN1679_c0_g1_i1.p3  ORF type:complete len:143 (-),score=24.56 TRINITY_DN1679_c0_g1_i1:496-924(-)